MTKVGKYCSVQTANGRRVIKRVTLTDEEEKALFKELLKTNTSLLKMCWNIAESLSNELRMDKEKIALALFDKVAIRSFTILQAALDEKVNKIKLNDLSI